MPFSFFRSPLRWLRTSLSVRRGFSVIELVMALVILGMIAGLTIAKLSPSKEATARAAMKNDLRNYALAEELYSDGHAAYADTTAMRTDNGFHYTPKVYPDSQELVGASEWYLRVGHQQSNTRCELRVKGPANSNTPKIYCYTQVPGDVTPLGLDFSVDTVAPGVGGGGGARMSSRLSVAASASQAPTALSALAPSPIADGDGGRYGWKNTLYFTAYVTLQAGEEITGLTWDLGDGTHLDGPSAERRYVASGVKTVLLSVSTSKNRSAEITKSLVMINHKPVAVMDAAEDTTGTGALGNLRLAPSALASAAVEVRGVRKFTATAERSYDPDGVIVRPVWDVGDWTPRDTGMVIRREFIGTGRYLLRLTVYDDEDQASDPSDATLIVQPDTSSIHACFTFDTAQAKTDRAVPFDASCSTTSKGTIVAYMWDYGDFTNAGGLKSSKRFRGTGVYAVHLTAINSLGKSDDTTQTVTVISPDDVPRTGLTAFWDACVGPVTGQVAHETTKAVNGVSEFDGQRGLTNQPDHFDPLWLLSPPLTGRTEPLAMWAIVPDDSSYMAANNSASVYNSRQRYILSSGFHAAAGPRTVVILASAVAKQNATGTLFQAFATSRTVYPSLEVSLTAAGNVEVYIGAYNTPVALAPTVAWPFDGALHTLAVTQANDSVTVSIDGVRRGAAGAAGQTTVALTNGAALFSQPDRAANAQFGYDGFTGAIGAVLFYERKLTQAEMLTTHTSLATRRCAGGALPATINIVPDTLVVQVGSTGTFQVELRDATNTLLADRAVNWTVPMGTVATIAANGTVTGVAVGTARVYAESEGRRDSATVLVKTLAVPANPENYWTTCRGYGTQVLPDIAGGSNGYLGTTAGTDLQDPPWSMTSMPLTPRVAFPVLRAGVASADHRVTMPTGVSGVSTAHTFAFLLRPLPGNSAGRSTLLSGSRLVIQMAYGANAFIRMYGATPNNVQQNGGGTVWFPIADFAVATPALSTALQAVVVVVGDTTVAGVATARVYVDGVLRDSKPFPGISMAGDLRLFDGGLRYFTPGLNQGGGSQFLAAHTSAVVDFGGLVHWSRVLSAAEVAQASTALQTLDCPLPPASPARVVVSPNPTEVAVGGTRALNVTGYTWANDTVPVVRPLWETTDASLATVDSTGRVTGIALGQVYIRATSDWASDSTLVTVAADALPAGEVGHWSACNSFGSQVVQDLSGNGYVGTLGSTPGVDASDPTFLIPENAPAVWTNPAAPWTRYVEIPNVGVGDGASAWTYVVAYRMPAQVAGQGPVLLSSNMLGLQLTSNGRAFVDGLNIDYYMWGGWPTLPVGTGVHTFALTVSLPSAGAVLSTLYADGVKLPVSGSGTAGGALRTGGSWVNPTSAAWRPGTVRLLSATAGISGGVTSALIYQRELSAADLVGITARLQAERCVGGVADALVVSPREVTVAVRATAALTAVTSQAGQPVVTTVAWTTKDPEIATISTTGVVTGRFAGTTYAVATTRQLRDSALVTVTRPTLPGNLQAHWDPCVTPGGQILSETVNGNNGTLGYNTSAEAADPTWVAATGTRPPLLHNARDGVSRRISITNVSPSSARGANETVLLYFSGLTQNTGWNGDQDRQEFFLVFDPFNPGVYSTSGVSALSLGNGAAGLRTGLGAMPTDGLPHIYAWVGDSLNSQVRTYIDGVQVGTAALSRVVPTSFNTLFYEGSGAGKSVRGDLGPVLYYNKALSATEVGTMSYLLLRTPCAPAFPTLLATLAPNPMTTYVGHTSALTLTVRDSVGASIAPTGTWLWTSANPGVATVSAGGDVTGLVNGTTTVTATNGTLSATASVTVRTIGLKAITITPPSATLALNRSSTFTATITDSMDVVRPDLSVQWSGGVSSDGTLLIGTMTPTGLATTFRGLAVGSTTIRASRGAIGGSATVTVTPARMDTLHIYPKTATIALGSSLNLTALASAEMGSPASLDFVWSQTPGTKGTLSALAGQNHRQVFTASDTGVVRVAVGYGASADTAVVTIIPSGPSAEFTWMPAIPSIFDAPISLDARYSRSGVGGSPIVRYEWSMDGWVFATGVTASIADPLLEDTPVELRVIDQNGAQATTTHLIPVRGVLTGRPLANFTFTPAAPRRLQTVTFDASSSTAGTGTSIAAYAWATSEGALAATVSPTTAFQYAGGAEVVLTVTAANGTTDEAHKVVPVGAGATLSLPPIAVLTCPATATLPAAGFACDASASSDPEGQPLRYTWFASVGSGTPLLIAGSTAVLTGVPIGFQRSGTFDLRVLVTDVDDQSAWAVARVKLTDPANGVPDPCLTVSSQNAAPGDVITISGACTTDPEGDDLVFEFIVILPDGSQRTFFGTRTGGVNTGVTFPFTVPTGPGMTGTYKVSMRVRDVPTAPRKTAEAPEISATIKVTPPGDPIPPPPPPPGVTPPVPVPPVPTPPAPPPGWTPPPGPTNPIPPPTPVPGEQFGPHVPVGGIPPQGEPGQPVTVSVRLDDGSAATFTVDWGDGQFSTCSGSTFCNPSHTYPTAGTYSVRVRCVPDDGLPMRNGTWDTFPPQPLRIATLGYWVTDILQTTWLYQGWRGEMCIPGNPHYNSPCLSMGGPANDGSVVIGQTWTRHVPGYGTKPGQAPCPSNDDGYYTWVNTGATKSIADMGYVGMVAYQGYSTATTFKCNAYVYRVPIGFY